MTNSFVLKLPHLAGISGDEPRESGEVLWAARLREGRGDDGEGVRQLLWRHPATCLGLEILSGSARPAWGCWGIGLVNTMVYLVYCSYYLVPVTTSSIPSLHWIYDTMIRELEPQRLGVL